MVVWTMLRRVTEEGTDLWLPHTHTKASASVLIPTHIPHAQTATTVSRDFFVLILIYRSVCERAGYKMKGEEKSRNTDFETLTVE